MSRRPVPRGAGLAAVLLLAAGAAPAGSLSVRDADGGTWTVTEDPVDGAAGFLLNHLATNGSSDARFGRNGQVAFSLTQNHEAPASVRVDAARRVWMVGTNVVAGQPQPVVARFAADGSIDTHWGVQGKAAVLVNGTPIRPNDLLPLADGSVLVAGETDSGATPHAVAVHLNADGSLDRAFGVAGVWQPADANDASTATSLSASSEGVAGVAVVVRGARPQAQLWGLTGSLPQLLLSRPLDTNADGEDLRASFGPEGWRLGPDSGATAIVPPASLGAHAAASASAAAAASEPDAGGFNPFVAQAASAPQAGDDAGLPWGWLGTAGVALIAAVALLWRRARRPGPVLRAPPRR